VTAPRARVVRRGAAALGVPLMASGPSPTQRRRIAREELEARLAAETIVQEAHAKADAILLRAREDGQAAATEAGRQARVDAETELVARWIALRDKESRRLDSDAERIVPVAMALAERLVCATLELEPTRIAGLAAGVFAEARGARRASIQANPVDAEVLRRHLSEAGLDPASVEVQADESLARGALRLHTDLGIIDAQLAPRLERLAEALRDALR
jgi:flagellar biosynthesis/type III secretory pathway protein FliH